MPVQPSGAQGTVLVLGASYAGNRAAQVLAGSLPVGWRVVVIERNTYVLHHGFIPYSNIFGDATKDPNSPHRLIHANVTRLDSHSVTYTSLDNDEEAELSFDYLIYALGSKLPAPIDLWATSKRNPTVLLPLLRLSSPLRLRPYLALTPRGTKPEGCRFLRKQQTQIQTASSVLVVGGGPLGIQYASDIKDLYPTKEVTLVHSRAQLLPRFNEYLHYASIEKLEELGVKVVLSSRVNGRELFLSTGEKVGAELVLICTGQKPNTSFLASFAPESVNPLNGSAYVTRTMQLAQPPIIPSPPASPDLSFDDELSFPEPDEDYLEEEEVEDPEEQEDISDDFVPKSTIYPHIFVVGDASDAFGALNAGHTAWDQAEVAAANVVALVKTSQGEATAMGQYYPPPFLIKVSLGFKHAIFQSRELCGTKGEQDCKDPALNSHVMWTRRGLSTDDMTI
ncbi:hypothetical protein DL96DRAFT_1598790 [Flagelloscypha sp. PMI_526]|nr:hypothetical protein DL96DRAFT_1598790 [Flagelloscypha sp. PMI_526]